MRIILLIITLFMLSGCSMWPPYNVWQQKMQGEANLAQATYDTKVAVQEAMAKESAAEHLANAEVARAKGVAAANAIIGDSLKNNEAYLRWLYIEAMKEKTGQEIVYIPTEAGLPILEARDKRIGK